MENGKLVYEFPRLTDLREYAQKELSTFWEEYLRIDMPALYKVDLSEKLHALKTKMISDIREKNAEK